MATASAKPAPKKTAAAKPAPKPKAEKAPKPKVERDIQNDVTRPKSDSKTGRIWAIADEISKSKKAPATRAEVMEKAVAEDINEATVATQYQQIGRASCRERG